MERKEVIERITPHRTMPFFGEINADLYIHTRDHLLKMVAESKTEAITVLIDSRGGDAFQALQIVDLLRAMPVETIGVTLEAASSAVFVLQACQKRLIMPSGRILIHSVRTNVANCNCGEFEEALLRRAIEQNRITKKLITDLFCLRTKLSDQQIAELTKRGDDLNYYMYAEEAIQLGFVDDIVPATYKLFIPTAPDKKLETPKEGNEPIISTVST